MTTVPVKKKRGLLFRLCRALLVLLLLLVALIKTRDYAQGSYVILGR